MFEFVNPYEDIPAKASVDTFLLNKERAEFFENLEKNEQKERFDFILSLLSSHKNYDCDFSSSVVKLGSSLDLSNEEFLNLQYALRFFKPWKKGPFDIFGVSIDSEWKSNLKWDRIKSQIGVLSDKVIADIGCHNGYFMFRLLKENPKLVMGFDPVPKLFYNFQFLQKIVRSEKLFYEPLGVESVVHFKSFFDTVLCLGILYHRTDPIETLRTLHASIKRGGKILIDCQGIEGEGSYCLFPEKKYAGARGVWFLPTKTCLINWLKRAQFRNVTCFYEEPLSPDEQRATEWAPIASLEEYLNKDILSSTIEGYPAPKRFYLTAHK